jgi:hypothetical protein
VNAEVIEFNDAVELLNYVRPWRSEHWGHGGEWIFRGHAASNWQLLPCAWRRPGDQTLAVARAHFQPVIATFIKHFMSNGSVFVRFEECTEKNVVEALSSYCAERELIASFHRTAHRTLGTRRYFLEDYAVCRGALFFQADYEWPQWTPATGDTLAQHYGIPTRLLDWSRSPLAALSFLSFEQRAVSEGPLALWCLDLERLRPTDTGAYTWHATPDYESNLNARQQGGVLTFVRRAEPYHMINGSWPPHDAVAHFAEGERTPLRKLVLASSQRAVLAELLLKEGWSLISLKPSLDSVAKSTLVTFPWMEIAKIAGRSAEAATAHYNEQKALFDERIRAFEKREGRR